MKSFHTYTNREKKEEGKEWKEERKKERESIELYASGAIKQATNLSLYIRRQENKFKFIFCFNFKF